MKYKQPLPGFELILLSPFPMTTTVTSQVPPKVAHYIDLIFGGEF